MERGGNKRSIDHYVLGKTLVRMLAYADVCWRKWNAAETSALLPTNAGVFWRMLQDIGSFGMMKLTVHKADVCRRMLTYDDVCYRA
jgi:hypothetical protein